MPKRPEVSPQASTPSTASSQAKLSPMALSMKSSPTPAKDCPSSSPPSSRGRHVASPPPHLPIQAKPSSGPIHTPTFTPLLWQPSESPSIASSSSALQIPPTNSGPWRNAYAAQASAPPSPAPPRSLVSKPVGCNWRWNPAAAQASSSEPSTTPASTTPPPPDGSFNTSQANEPCNDGNYS